MFFPLACDLFTRPEPRSRGYPELRGVELSSYDVKHLSRYAVLQVWSEGRRLVSQSNVSSAGWTQVDVTGPARHAGERGRPLLLELRCTHCRDAALNVLAEPTSHVRAKRATRSDCGKDGLRCCR